MNKIDFKQPGGFPLTQDTLGFLQQAYSESLQSICSILGNKVILNGCEEKGGMVAPGFVVVNGEVLPTLGGSGESVFIEEIPQDVIFRDTSIQNVYFTRVLQFGVGEGSLKWNEFVRLSDLASTQNLLESSVPYLVPKGAIMMWAGTTPPEGWALCDGTKGTPDLRGRFIAGYNPIQTDYNSIGKKGGTERVWLSSNEQGTFTIQLQNDNGDNKEGSYTSITNIRINGKQVSRNQNAYNIWNAVDTIKLTSASQAHENRPPYYVLAYIQKL